MSSENNNKICNDFMHNNCKRIECKFIHRIDLCFRYWSRGSCKYGNNCRKKHDVSRIKNKTGTKTNKTDTTTNKTDTITNKTDTITNKTDTTTNKTDTITNKTDTITNKTDTTTNKTDNVKTLMKKNKRRVKNTECFDPMVDPVDLRIVYDLCKDNLSIAVTSRDVVIVPNLFSDFPVGDIYNRLVSEINECGIPENQLLKLWHGDTHLIADDHLKWKSKSPTFNMVIERIKKYFKMDIKATRFNLYKDTNQWKPFHHDAAAVKKDKMNTQNFTVGVSFGVTRDAAFEHSIKRTTVSIPQPDGCIYAFSKDTNIIWKHGILQDKLIRNQGRISVIAWGWIDDQINL
jgi:hypothetical protein